MTRADLLTGGARHGAAIAPGHPEQSVLLRVLRGELAPRMPLGGKPLGPEQVGVISEWIRHLEPEVGEAEGEKTWWAFRPLQKPEPPEAKGEGWLKSPIDRFVLAKLENDGLKPSAEAPTQVLMRRAYFDLIGVPPTPEETRSFLADNSPDAYGRLIDKLLEDPRYGERWGRHWLDLARYADSMGFEADREQYHMWRYRDWVIKAFNDDKPYDEFVREQLAGDEIDPDDIEKRIALGFLRLGPVFQTTIAAELRQLLLNETTSTISSVFLGMTIGCAQCHDHKYDPISQKDFYRLQAFLLPIEFKEVDAPFQDPALKARMERERRAAEERLEEAQQTYKAYENRLLVKLREIYQAEGKPVDEVNPRTLKVKLTTGVANALVPNDDPTFSLEEKKKYLDLLNFVDGRMGGRDMGMYRRQVERHKAKAHSIVNMAVSGFGPQPPVQFVRLRGEYNRLGERVDPGFLSAATGNTEPAKLPTDKFGNVRTWRIALADWIVSEDNPLTARVMVNRIWQHHFGRGIVATPSDFGRNGARPTHRELLDWLSVRFIEQGWSVKSMHRLMMNSATYKQSSQQPSAKGQEADPANRLLWRFERRRLEGELIRDSILAVSGRLNPEMGGPGVYPPLPKAIKDRTRIKNFTAWEASEGPDSRKRSVYIFQRRQLEVPFLTLMDAPTLQAPREERSISTTALQALTLMNGRLVNEESSYFAARVRKEAGSNLDKQIERAFRLTFSRVPTEREIGRARQFVASEKEDGLVGLCRILYNTNEFVYVD